MRLIVPEVLLLFSFSSCEAPPGGSGPPLSVMDYDSIVEILSQPVALAAEGEESAAPVFTGHFLDDLNPRFEFTCTQDPLDLPPVVAGANVSPSERKLKDGWLDCMGIIGTRVGPSVIDNDPTNPGKTYQIIWLGVGLERFDKVVTEADLTFQKESQVMRTFPMAWLKINKANGTEAHEDPFGGGVINLDAYWSGPADEVVDYRLYFKESLFAGHKVYVQAAVEIGEQTFQVSNVWEVQL